MHEEINHILTKGKTMTNPTYPLEAGAGGVGSGVGCQSFLTGGGRGVVTVLVVTCEMICTASFMAWYMRSISSLRIVSSSDSCIRLLCVQSEKGVNTLANRL